MRSEYLLSGMVLAACVLPPLAQAQTVEASAPAPSAAANESGGEIEEIVVTAFGRQQKLRDVPVSVLAISGSDIEKQALVSPQDIAVRQPGFRISPSPASDYIFIRGVGSSANIGFEQSVSTFLDGVYRGRSRDIRMALFDLERVEVLRGPQTTFFGNNTIAGALNLVSRKPGHDFAVNGSAYYSPDYGEHVVEGGVDLPVNDRFRLRFSARHSGMTGYIANSQTGEKGPDNDDMVGRVSMVWTPVDRVEIEARIDAGRMRDKGTFNVELTQCSPPAAFGTAAGPCGRFIAAKGGVVDSTLDYHSDANASVFDYDFIEAAQTTRIELGNHQLSLTTGLFDRDYDLLNDPVPVPGTLGGSPISMAAGLPIALAEHYHQFSQEIRLASSEDLPISYIAGAYYQRSTMRASLYQGMYFAAMAGATGGALPVTTPVASFTSLHERSETGSGFGAVTWRATDRLKLNGGLRFTSVSKRDQRQTAIGSAQANPSAGFTPFDNAVQTILYPVIGLQSGDFDDPRRTDNKLMFSGSAQYDFGSEAGAYVSFSQGFKAGGFSSSGIKSTFRPETVDAWEVGVKGMLLGDLLRYTLAVFDSRYRDLQETTTVLQGGTTVQVATNAGRSIVRGVELGATVQPARAVTLGTNLTYLSAKYDDYPNGPCTTLQQTPASPCVQDLSGKRRALSPTWSGNIFARYEQDVTRELKLTAELTSYFSTWYYVLANADDRMTQKGYAKIDARLSLGRIDDRWEMALIGRNLTDKMTANYRQVVPGSAGAIGVLADPPRSIGAQVRFAF